MVRTAFKAAVLAGLASGACLAASPSKALTLVDNTSEATKSLGSSTGAITGLTPGSVLVGLSFTTNANWQPYTQFSFKVPLTNSLGNAALTNLTLNIFNATAAGDPTGSAIFSTSYASQVGRYGTYLADFADGAYNSFFIDTVTPIFVPNARYVFVFSSSDPIASIGWTINGVVPAGATNQTFATLLASRRSTDGGTSWSTPGTPGGFFLDGVPGPLPLLGAGSAFAWSRRLRRRVATAKSLASTLN